LVYQKKNLMRPFYYSLYKPLITVILIAFSIVAFSQQGGYVEIKGKIKQERDNIPGAKITVFENGSVVKSTTSDAQGKFEVKLDLDKTYILEFSKANFVTKKVKFETAVTEKQYVWSYPFTIELFDMMDGLDVSALSQPVTVIKFSQGAGDFQFDEAYTNSMKSQIDKIMAQHKQLKKTEYDRIIKQADDLYKEKKYEEAIKIYEKAIDVDPFPEYPDIRIDLCEKMLIQQGKNEGNYDDLIASGDDFFADQAYEEAKADYQDALALKPNEAYPKNRIAEIDNILKNKNAADEAAKKEQDYKNAIARGDSYMEKKVYISAKSEYETALKIKPNEAYPIGKIAEIDKLLGDQKALAEKEKAYKDAIAKGDGFFTATNYPEAKNQYTLALGMKPAEKYPADRIAEIDRRLAQAQAESDRDQLYKERIAAADALLAEKKLAEAKAKYTDASNTKPTEQYPKTKIAEIDKLLADQKTAADKEKAYQDQIAAADGLFNTQKYTEAKAEYNKAAGMKPAEQYPKTKISEIDKILADQKANADKEKAYADAIAKADASFNLKKYEEAKTSYNSALSFKSNEEYPKTKIAEIDKILADQKAAAEKDKAYQDAIAKADASLNAKKYEEAKSGYNSALSIKSTEQYPKTKIAEIDKILADQLAAAEKDKAYQDAIAKADASLSAKKYDEAKSGYNSALAIKSTEQYPKTKIAEIDKILADQMAAAEKDKAYQDAIAKADASLNAKKYDEAKSGYNSALAIKSTEQYPKTKIAEIDKILADQLAAAEKDKAYQDAIAKADASLNAKKYDEAKSGYNAALAIQSTEQYPKTKIAEIEKILADQMAAAEKDKAYNDAIAKADASLASKKYDEAKSSYNSALAIKSTEEYPKTKIAEIDKILADQKAAAEKDKAYQDAIAKADASFNSKKYDEAKSGYNSALSIKSTEQYPKTKIAEIDKILADQMAAAEKDKAYQDAISKADASLSAKKYDEAKSGYNSALAIKSTEQYPKTKIAEIDKILADQLAAAEKDKAYQDAVAKADASLNAKKYDEAKTGYNAALAIKSTEQYPKTKIAEIEKILADQMAAAEKDKAYKDAIAKADASLASKKYDEAKSSYNSALAIKSTEEYPKTKIAEIDKILADQKAAAEKDKAYQDAIAKADASFNSKKYEEAKSGYNSALAIKSTEQYPKTKIAEIDKILADQMAAAEKDKAYQDAISKADASLSAKKYDEAKSGYNSALAIKSTEQYPKTKIAEIDKILADQLAAAEKDKAYQDAIAKADASLNAKKYDEAKSGYNAALAIKSTEQYPKTKIAEIDKILADQKSAAEKEKAYNDAIAKADGFFGTQKYSEAKTEYNKATAIKADEQYPKTKIAEIDKILADQKAAADKEKAYNDAIAKADASFNSKKYEEAKSSYNSALAIKSTEQYPKTKIAEIDKILADQMAAAEKDKAYQDAISKADASLSAKKYEEAKSGYNAALAIKANEQYPKTKIAEIDKLIADQKVAAEKDKAYNDAIAKADASFNAKKYDEAKTGYNAALAIKSTEQYPKTKIAEIDKLIADAKSAADKEKAFSDAILAADALFTEKKYAEAKTEYNKALALKPAELHPKNRIAEIDKLLADAKATAEKDKQYNDAIAKADGFYDTDKLNEAKAEYNKASLVKPDEAYPKNRIREIDDIIAKKANQALADKEYAELIKAGDASFNAKKYEEAKGSFSKAVRIKPDEQYPKQKLGQITAILDQAAAEKQKEQNYKDAIARGDGFFGSGKWEAAKKEYTAALGIKPDEQYPKTKIAECDKAIEESKQLKDLIFASDEDRNKYLKDLATRYPEGVTREDYEMRTKKIKRYIVVRSGIANEYREVTQSWGGVAYYKNDKNIESAEFYQAIKN